MSETPAAATTDGLRARNRERTVQSLEQAAWELVAEHGFEAVTADAVADRAGVSRRTFFNYFPRVELVLQEPMRQAIAGLVDRFVARPVEENVSESLAAILTEPLDAVVLEKAITCFGQASTSSAARYFVMEAQASEVDQIAQALMERDPSMDALYARVVAGCRDVRGIRRDDGVGRAVPRRRQRPHSTAAPRTSPTGVRSPVHRLLPAGCLRHDPGVLTWPFSSTAWGDSPPATPGSPSSRGCSSSPDSAERWRPSRHPRRPPSASPARSSRPC